MYDFSRPLRFQWCLFDLQLIDILFINKSETRKYMNWGHGEYIKHLMPWSCHLILAISLRWFSSKQWILEEFDFLICGNANSYLFHCIVTKKWNVLSWKNFGILQCINRKEKIIFFPNNICLQDTGANPTSRI